MNFSQTSATSWRRSLFSLHRETIKLTGQQDKTAFKIWEFMMKMAT